MRVLVVGGNGFIGSHLVDRLVRMRWEVTVLDSNVRQFGPIPPEVHFVRASLTSVALDQALEGADAVVHLAWAGFHETSNRSPASDVELNVLPTLRLIEAAVNRRGLRFVFTSSGGTVYGPAQELPIGEDHPKNPLSAYGVNKLTVEKFLCMFHELDGIDYVVLRPSVPYGPRQSPLRRQGAVAVFLHRIAHGLPVEIWGDGGISRDYFYVEDLVSALIASLETELADERIFNVAGRREISLRELVSLIEEVVGREAVVTYHPSRKFDAYRLSLDTERARRILGWRPEVEMEEGLERTWRWQSEVF